MALAPKQGNRYHSSLTIPIQQNPWMTESQNLNLHVGKTAVSSLAL